MENLAEIKEIPQKKTITIDVQPDGTALVPTIDSEGRALKLYCGNGVELEPTVKQFQAYIAGPPATQEQLYSKACSNDGVTINSWRDQWINQAVANNAKYSFEKDSVLSVAGSERYKPVIIAGSGPSLKKNAHLLKPTFHKRIYPVTGETWEMWGGKGDIKIVSCLHNFSYFEDLGVMTKDDFYITLDAGEITIKEIYEGGKHSPEWYWERTKDRTLVAFTSTHPKLLEQWQGKILWYTTPPNPATFEALKPIIDLTKIPGFNVGGNVLGAAFYMARAILGCGTIISIGADFSFSKDRSFHAWKTPYDNMFSGVEPVTDIYGDRVYSWNSYINFKSWFDFMACGGQSNTTHQWINCTEGGILGAYPGGNIQQIRQMTLKDCLSSLNIYSDLDNAMKGSKDIARLLF
jgi:hypothetical protein